jgi:hypothetical protein
MQKNRRKTKFRNQKKENKQQMNVEKNKSSIPTLLVDFLAKRARQSLLLEMTFPCAHIQRRSRNVHGPFFFTC